MKRRVTVLFPIAGLPFGGAEQQLLELVKALNKARFSPIVLTLQSGPLEEDFKAVPGVRLVSLKRRGKYDFLVLLKIFTLLRRMKVDVIQPFITPATFYGLLAALICRTPVKIVTERSGPSRKKDFHLGYRFYLAIEDFLTRFADSVVANSEAGKFYLIQRGIASRRVKVIYNGINLRRLGGAEDKVQEVRRKLNLPSGGRVVGMMAKLFPVKNHAMFLQAAALISNVLPDTRFALVGDGPLRGQLEELSHDLGLESKVVFFGDQRDVGDYLSAFDIAVLTSNTEGCSNSLLEAMGLGKPVVATDVGGNRELVRYGETGLLVPPRDVEALAEAVIALVRDPKTAESMGRRASDRVIAQFSQEVMVQQYQALYEESLRQNSCAEEINSRQPSSCP